MIYKSGNIVFKKSNLKNAQGIIAGLKDAGIEIVPFTEKHLSTYAGLDIDSTKNKDPNDHIIVAQAISDKIPLISSDQDFKNYTSQGLDFIFNKK